MEVVAGIAQHRAAVALEACRVAQSLAIQLDPIGVILNAVGRNFVVGVVYQRRVGAIEPSPFPSADSCRKAKLFVVRAAEQLNGALKRFGGHVVGVETEHATDGIAAIKQCCRPFDDLSTVHGELVNLQSVVVAPLLSLVLDAILADGKAVEAQSAYGRFGLS